MRTPGVGSAPVPSRERVADQTSRHTAHQDAVKIEQTQTGRQRHVVALGYVRDRSGMMATNRPVALVTGASSGIGKEAALALVAAGFEVAGTGRDASRVAPLQGVTFLDLDVISDKSVTAAVEQVIKRFGRIDVLVNNAGIGSIGAAEETSVEQAQVVFDINVLGVMRMVKEVLPHMRAQGRGRILRFVPAWVFDRQIRKMNKLTG
jgi:hypothetical protein